MTKVSIWARLSLHVTDRWFRYVRVPLILRHFHSGDIVVDCGANIGVYTKLFAKTGATVYAFEPHPLAFAALKKRTEGLCNVHCLNKAVADRDGRTKLYFKNCGQTLEASQSASLMAEKDNVSTESFVEVDTVRLVTFLEQFEAIRFLKMDIEGAEYIVLPDLIRSGTYRRVKEIVVETHERSPGLKAGHTNLLSLLVQQRVPNIDLSWH